MKLLLVVLTTVNVVFSAPDPSHRVYTYTLSSDQAARSEIGHPDGTVTRAYNYLDKNNIIHKVQYVGDSHELEIISHKIEPQEVVVLNNGFTAEVDAARKAHLEYQKTLRASHSVLKKEQTPILVRYVPSQTDEVHIYPYVHIPPLRNVHVAKKVEVEPLKKIVVEHIDKPHIHIIEEKKPYPLASEVKLVNGFTKEVAEATNQHLAVQQSIRKSLPPVH